MARQAVVVLGGGVAGLTAAHELAERDFAVTVVEPKALGGRARSIGVPGTATDGRQDLPGEHGFRFFPGFYQDVIELMGRIPLPGGNGTVAGNLVELTTMMYARDGRRGEVVVDVSTVEDLTMGTLLRRIGAWLSQGSALSADEALYYANRLMVFLTSCQERRRGQWEYLPWWDFVAAAGASAEYQKVCAIGTSRSLVAARAEVASTKTLGTVQEAFVLNNAGWAGYVSPPDRVLNAPTNQAWIDPWVAYLASLGVRFQTGWAADRLRVTGSRTEAVVLRDRSAALQEMAADWFVLAVPLSEAVRLARQDLAADAGLAGLDRLVCDWMVGLQFYLRRRTPIVAGHVLYLDSPWALTSISQAQFWPQIDFAATFGDGTVQDCLSVDISDWDSPGLFGKPARECSRQEVAADVWAQLSAALNGGGDRLLSDDLVHSWFLDPAVTGLGGPGPARNAEPLFINTVGSWDDRPQAGTAIDNLFIAGDFARTEVDLATMEGATQSGRAAVNALLARSGHAGPPCPISPLPSPPQLASLRGIDEQMYRQGRPNMFDMPPPWRQAAVSAGG
jgi:uncharacterized protein with NAD-binding domain and iron-sulfur cluster